MQSGNLKTVMSPAVEKIFEAVSAFRGTDTSKVPTIPHSQGQKYKQVDTGAKFPRRGFWIFGKCSILEVEETPSCCAVSTKGSTGVCERD